MLVWTQSHLQWKDTAHPKPAEFNFTSDFYNHILKLSSFWGVLESLHVTLGLSLESEIVLFPLQILEVLALSWWIRANPLNIFICKESLFSKMSSE